MADLEKSNNLGRDITLGQLRQFGGNAKTILAAPKFMDDTSGVMRGNFSYRNHRDGLSLHGGQFTELNDIKSCFELPSGISFNLVFEGCIDFVFAGNAYQLKPSGSVEPACACIIAANPEVVTRHLHRGQSVYKLNLFVERAWLEERCDNSEDFQLVQQLFCRHVLVHQWRPSRKIVRLAKALLRSEGKKNGFLGQLNSESQCVGLLSALIEELHQCLSQQEIGQSMEISLTEKQLFKRQVDEHLQSCQTLPALASALNTSVSTLQRKFKSLLGTTVTGYMRQRRLETARTAMLEERMSVGQAAFYAGYKHPSNFVTAFKRQFSITPHELKKAHL